MKNYIYINSAMSTESSLRAMRAYAKKHDLSVDASIEETVGLKSHWKRRGIGKWLDTAQKGDSLIVFQATDLARSTSQMLEILTEVTVRELNIHFVKYGQCFEGKPSNDLGHMLSMLQNIENDYISRRTTDALARRKAAGLPLGRPKGRKNKSLKLDRHRKEIMHYLDLCISKASIAKLVGCHPQTLYDWIERHEIADKKPRKPRTRKLMVEIAQQVGTSAVEKDTETV